MARYDPHPYPVENALERNVEAIVIHRLPVDKNPISPDLSTRQAFRPSGIIYLVAGTSSAPPEGTQP